MKKTVSLLAAAILLAFSCGFSALPKVNRYIPGQFHDVPDGVWYADSVRVVCEYGLMRGTGNDQFNADDKLTFAQALAMACRLHDAYFGNHSVFDMGDVWYQPYVQYARENKITDKTYDYEAIISRADFVKLLAAALPPEALPEIAWVADHAIPDIPAHADYAAAAYQLYRAGILSGNDGLGTFAPENEMTRAQAAVLLSRMADVSLRQQTMLTGFGDANKTAQLYAQIEQGIRNFKGISGEKGDYIDLAALGLSNADGSKDRMLLYRVFKKVMQDYPELFWATSGYTRIPWDDNPNQLAGVRPKYFEFAKDPDAIAACNAAVEAALAQVEGVADPVAQILILHDYVIEHSVYNWEIAVEREKDAPADVRSIYAALVSGDTVCRGYANTFQLLLKRLGIECLLVESEEMNHVWNMVKLDGKWYHLDVNQSNNNPPSLRGYGDHIAFLMSDATARQMDYRGWQVPWMEQPPICNDDKYKQDWIFCDTPFPLYHKNGRFYAVRRENNAQCGIYYGNLSEQGEKIADIPLFTNDTGYVYSGIVWWEDYLYFVNSKNKLLQYQLNDGEITEIGEVPFTAQPSQDENYKANKDAIGLYMDGNKIVAVSRTQRKVLAKFPVS